MRRASSASAFLVACVGIAFFSCMDAIMKHVSIAIGAYNAMLWRSMIGVALSAPLFFGGGLRWPDRGRLLLHVKRSGAAGIFVAPSTDDPASKGYQAEREARVRYEWAEPEFIARLESGQLAAFEMDPWSGKIKPISREFWRTCICGSNGAAEFLPSRILRERR